MCTSCFAAGCRTRFAFAISLQAGEPALWRPCRTWSSVRADCARTYNTIERGFARHDWFIFARAGALSTRARAVAPPSPLPPLQRSATPALAQQADLVVNQADSPDPGPAGGVFTYTIRVDNNGPFRRNRHQLRRHAATRLDVRQRDDHARDLQSAGGGRRQLRARHARVPRERHRHLKVILPTPGVWTNVVTATSAVADPNTSNNVNVSESTTAENASDMRLTVVDAPDPIAAGGAYSYTLTATNLGPTAAAVADDRIHRSDRRLRDGRAERHRLGMRAHHRIPAVLGHDQLHAQRVARLGRERTHLTVPAVANVAGSITAAFTVSSPLPDGDTTNNTATATTTVNGGSTDLSIAKTANLATVGVGSPVIFTLTPQAQRRRAGRTGRRPHHGRPIRFPPVSR